MNEEKLLIATQLEFDHTTLAKSQLLASLRDSDYRREFVKERVHSSIALQIRAVRRQRGNMTQSELGAAVRKAQTWISKLEDPEYGKMTVATLLRLAAAFDTDLEIKFRPFSELIESLSTQGPSYFNVQSFQEEFEFQSLAAEDIATVDLIENRRFATPPVRQVQSSAQDRGHLSGNISRSDYPGIGRVSGLALMAAVSGQEQNGNHQSSTR